MQDRTVSQTSDLIGGDKFVSVETDQDKALRYKNSIQALAQPITDLLNQAGKDGLVISFSFSNQNGHWFLSPVGVHKPL